MDILKRFLQNNESVSIDSVHETIERLSERFRNSFRLEDRRDALRALKSLSKDYRVEVGSQAIFICSETLAKYSEDVEICCYALDILYNTIKETKEGTNSNLPSDIGHQFTEMLLKDQNNIKILIDFIDYYDMTLRMEVIKLLIEIIRNCRRESQDAILKTPNGISRIVDLLACPLEPLRNSAILLLIELTCNNKNIQRIVAFENTFTYIFRCLENEDQSDGSGVVEDCLLLLHQLIQMNIQNQVNFRENNFIKKIVTFFNSDANAQRSSVGWARQKVVNVQSMFKIIRSLVSPLIQCQTNQQHMLTDGLLKKLCDLILTVGIPTEIHTEVIITSGEMVRNLATGQKILANHVIGDISVQFVILRALLNSQQLFSVRLAAHYCYSCLIYNNDEIKRGISASFFANATNFKIGPNIVGGLSSTDSTTIWFTSIILSHIIHKSNELKKTFSTLAVLMPADNSRIPLLQYCFNLIKQSGTTLQARVGLLQLLCTWLSHSVHSIDVFLSSGQTDKNSPGPNITLLIAEVATVDNDESEALIRSLAALLIGVCISYSKLEYRSQIIKIVEMRVKIDNLLERISQISRLDAFIKSSQHPQPIAKNPSELLFDYQFIQLFKVLEYEINKSISVCQVDKGTSVDDFYLEDNDSVPNQTPKPELNKDALDQNRLILEENNKLKAKLVSVESELAKWKSDHKILLGFVSLKNDEIKKLQAQLNTLKEAQSQGSPEDKPENSSVSVTPRIAVEEEKTIPEQTQVEILPPANVILLSENNSHLNSPNNVQPVQYGQNNQLPVYNHRSKKNYFSPIDSPSQV